MIKSMIMRCPEDVARMGEKRIAYRWESQMERDHYETRM
jgi:hypothetical protein